MRPAPLDVRAIMRERDDEVRLPTGTNAWVATAVEVGFWFLPVSRRLR